MKKILLIEDVEENQILIVETLKDLFEVSVAGTMTAAMKKLETSQYDLILLDIGLPDGNGFQLCSKIQDGDKNNRTPIVFLTARRGEDDKIMGYKLGADDYIEKPIQPRIFRAKISAKLRNLEKQSDQKRMLEKGCFQINTSSQRACLMQDGRETLLDLTPTEYRLLVIFMENEDAVLSREQLIDKVWRENVHITDRVVDMHISTLRKKLGVAGGCIKTVYGCGYSFNTKRLVENVSAA